MDSSPRITLWGEFKDPALEDAFRLHDMQYVRTLTLSVFAIAFTTSLLLFLSDLIFSPAPNVGLEIVRISFCLLVAGASYLIYRSTSHRLTNAANLLFVLVLMGGVVSSPFFRPTDFLLHFAVDVVILSSIYLVIPRIRTQFIVAIIFSIVLILELFFIKSPRYEYAALTLFAGIFIANALGLAKSLTHNRARRDVFLQLKEERSLRQELESAKSSISRLESMLPMCANCKNVRDDEGYWSGVEEYIRATQDAMISHSICPDCEKKLYPELQSQEL